MASLAATVTLAGVAPAAAMGSTGAPEDARERRSALLVQAAELTDRLEDAQAGVVAAQLRQARAAGTLAQLRNRMRARAVSAYVNGTGA
ncbi:MAG: hypothetical protein CYG61_07680, partial [Actinobacteria bacterium]